MICDATTANGQRCTRNSKGSGPFTTTSGITERRRLCLCNQHWKQATRGAIRVDVPAEYKPGTIRTYWTRVTRTDA